MTDISSDHSDARTIEALRTSEERFRVLFESGPMAVYSCDAAGVIQEFNHAPLNCGDANRNLGIRTNAFAGHSR